MIEQELDLDLEPAYTLQDVLNFLSANQLLRKHRAEIVVYARGELVPLSTRLATMVRNPAVRETLHLEVVKPSK